MLAIYLTRQRTKTGRGYRSKLVALTFRGNVKTGENFVFLAHPSQPLPVARNHVVVFDESTTPPTLVFGAVYANTTWDELRAHDAKLPPTYIAPDGTIRESKTHRDIFASQKRVQIDDVEFTDMMEAHIDNRYTEGT